MKTPQEIIQYIHENIDGRMCDEQNNCLFLASVIYEAGGGDYLEIGSLFGGTAIMASLILQDLGYAGEVYAIDPFDEYYKGTRNDNGIHVGAPIDPITRKSVTLERAQANAEKMGAKVNFIKGKATVDTLPKERSFSVAFIDGDHWNQGPRNDWHLVKSHVDKFIVFDNCDANHPAVEAACREAWADPEWDLVFKQGITCVFKRLGWMTCR